MKDNKDYQSGSFGSNKEELIGYEEFYPSITSNPHENIGYPQAYLKMEGETKTSKICMSHIVVAVLVLLAGLFIYHKLKK